MYLKITNFKECHHGLQYHDGLNIDPLPFAKKGSCVPGGIYFTTPEYICFFIEMGPYVREVTIPEDAEMVRDPDGNKWRASKIILGPRKYLGDVNTWKWLVENGVDVNDALMSASGFGYGYLEIVKYLIGKGADIHFENGWALRYAKFYDKLDVVKYLIEKGATK
jgi:hypothetical protein